MRIAVLSDLHANRHAFDALLAELAALRPDHVVVAGDVINRGPDPRSCLEEVLDRARTQRWRALKGNHEEFVLRADGGEGDRPGWERLLYAHTRWTRDRVRDLLPAVAAWPDHLSLTGPDGSEVRFAHASMRGNRHGMYEDMEAPVLADLAAPPPSVLVVGHTHIPFIRTLDGGTLIINAGAAGLPFDGCTDPSYAVLDWRDGGWRADIRRFTYDRAAQEEAYASSGYLDGGGPMVRLILHEHRQARPCLGLWHRRYEPAVAAGKLSIEDSVARLLEDVACPRAPRDIA